MSESTIGTDHSGRHIPYSTFIDGRSVTMWVTHPEDCEPSGLVTPIINGLASGPILHEKVALELAQRGHTVARFEQDGAREHHLRVARYAFTSLVQGTYNGIPLKLPENRQIIPTGYSHGARVTVDSLSSLKEAGDVDINGVVLQVPACLRGVNPRTVPFGLLRSFSRELREMSPSDALKYASEGTHSLHALGMRAISEVDSAVRGDIEPGIRRLQQAGVQFVAVEHPNDDVVNPEKNRIAYRRLGIPYISVNSPAYVGHVAPGYRPKETAEAIDEALNTVSQPYPRVA